MLGRGSISAVSLLCAHATNKANSILGCIKSSMASTSKGVIVPLFSALLRWHLEYYVQFWATWYRKDIDQMGQVQWRPTKMMRGWSTCPTE
ncbi:hypothetical protein QYF61_005254 [Mycteria americana]|uniref:Uncharacterized protein n=1 Tax=Mycteria americana TaxID=33587 RepID=A0AAN7PNQ2_MYCAM|nr:hypothetical protein QYF61_005254 [Mycteria americana]